LPVGISTKFTSSSMRLLDAKPTYLVNSNRTTLIENDTQQLLAQRFVF